MRESHRRLIHGKFRARAGNAIRALDELFRRPIMRVNDVKELIGQSYPVANRIMRELEDLGIVTVATGRYRNRVFEYAPYIDLMEEGPPGSRARAQS
jgi:Mn-dependent DtxR family transcriptional regulator